MTQQASGDRTLEQLSQPLRELRDRFAELTEPHRPALWRYCLRLTGSPWDAEDLVQETLTRAFARLTLFWQALDPRAYLFRIATNTWIDGWRRRGAAREEEPQPDAEAAEASPAEERTDPAEVWGAVETLVRLLPPRQRVAVLLVDVFDFRAAEVAAMLRMTEGAVKAALHRARGTLRAATIEVDQKTRRRAKRATPAPPALVARFLVNRRDPGAIAALMDAGTTVEIVGAAEEQGRDVTRRYSLSEWAADRTPEWAEPVYLFDRLAVCVYQRTPKHEKALAWLLTLEVTSDRITGERVYFYTPELIEYAAGVLEIPAHTHGYRYLPAGTDGSSP